MPQIRTAHIGSYPRTGDHKDQQRHRRGLAHFLNKDISAHAFRDVVQSVVQEVIQEQLTAGLDEVTDGLIAWLDPISHVTTKLGGVKQGGLARYFDTAVHYRIPILTGTLRRKEPLIVEEFQHAKSLSHKPVRTVLPGPLTLAALSTAATKALDKPAARADAFTDILEKEIEALAAAGAPIIQIDEPFLLRQPADIPKFQKALDRFKKKAGTSRLVVLINFLPPNPKLEILNDFIAADLNIDITTEPKARLDQIKPAGRRIEFGVINSASTRADNLDELHAALLAWLEKNPLDTVTLTPSAGLELVSREVAFEKLRRLASLKERFSEKSSAIPHGKK